MYPKRGRVHSDKARKSPTAPKPAGVSAIVLHLNRERVCVCVFMCV